MRCGGLPARAKWPPPRAGHLDRARSVQMAAPSGRHREENDAFCAFARWSQRALLRCRIFFLPSITFSRSLGLYLSLSLSSFSLHRPSRPRSPFALTFLRGRRQLPQAGEVRRPRRARGVVEVVGGNEVSSDTSSSMKRRQEGRGLDVPDPSPRAPGALSRTLWRKWGVRGGRF